MHKLALRMGRTVSELSATMTVDELTHWIAYDRIIPLGDERQDYLFAHLCLRVVEAAGAKRRGGGKFQIEDFLLFKRPAKPITPREFIRQRIGHLVKQKPKETDI